MGAGKATDESRNTIHSKLGKKRKRVQGGSKNRGGETQKLLFLDPL